MFARRGWSGLAVALCAFSFAACMGDDVVYVDSQGNEIAVDEQGQPILPQASPARAPSVVTSVRSRPVVTTEYEGAARERPGAPRPVPNDPDLPPTGALPDPTELPGAPPPAQSPSVAPAPKPGAKKVESSAGLDRPPAG